MFRSVIIIIINYTNDILNLKETFFSLILCNIWRHLFIFNLVYVAF